MTRGEKITVSIEAERDCPGDVDCVCGATHAFVLAALRVRDLLEQDGETDKIDRALAAFDKAVEKLSRQP
jgi:hypothetical protein